MRTSFQFDIARVIFGDLQPFGWYNPSTTYQNNPRNGRKSRFIFRARSSKTRRWCMCTIEYDLALLLLGHHGRTVKNRAVKTQGILNSYLSVLKESRTESPRYRERYYWCILLLYCGVNWFVLCIDRFLPKFCQFRARAFKENHRFVIIFYNFIN